jgi:hypothetical protein
MRGMIFFIGAFDMNVDSVAVKMFLSWIKLVQSFYDIYT